MLSLNVIFMSFVILFGHQINGLLLTNSWNYTLISVNGNTTNQTIFDWKADVVRISRTEFAISGYAWIGGQTSKSTMVEAQAFRSVTGSSDYIRLPLGMARCSFEDYMNTIYSNLVMKSIANCSTGPQFKGKFRMPLKTGLYVFNNCVLSTEKFPAYVIEGYYKVILKIDDPLVKAFEGFIIKIAYEVM